MKIALTLIIGAFVSTAAYAGNMDNKAVCKDQVKSDRNSKAAQEPAEDIVAAILGLGSKGKKKIKVDNADF